MNVEKILKNQKEFLQFLSLKNHVKPKESIFYDDVLTKLNKIENIMEGKTSNPSRSKMNDLHKFLNKNLL
jgi:hypothetical protein